MWRLYSRISFTVAFLVFSPPIANAFSSRSGSIKRFVAIVSTPTHGMGQHAISKDASLGARFVKVYKMNDFGPRLWTADTEPQIDAEYVDALGHEGFLGATHDGVDGNVCSGSDHRSRRATRASPLHRYARYTVGTACLGVFLRGVSVPLCHHDRSHRFMGAVAFASLGPGGSAIIWANLRIRDSHLFDMRGR